MKPFAFLALCAAAAACAPTVHQQEYPHRLTAAMCAAYVRCGASADAERCAAVLERNAGGIPLPSQAQLAASGRARYDGVFGAACVARIESAACGELFTVLRSEACERVYEGSRREGDSCSGFDCGYGLSCSTACSGTCRKAASEGQPSEGNACAPGLVDIEGTCVKPRAEGGACTPGLFAEVISPCEAGLYCDVTSKTCTKRGAENDACGPSAPCGPLLACIGATCAAPGRVGASCMTSFASSNIGQVCQIELRCDGTCSPLAGAGGSCISTQECELGLACVGVKFESQGGLSAVTAGSCQGAVTQGGDCASSPCLAQLYCDSASRCQPRKAVGAACADRECEVGLACRDGVCAIGDCP
jgi:hypothetical protein